MSVHMIAKNNSSEELRKILDELNKLAMFEGCILNSPESQNMEGDTPLHISAFDGRVNFLSIMLPFLNNINLKGGIGNTPLHYAVLREKLDAAKFLLDHGANAKIENDYGDTPIGMMESKPLFAKLMAVLK